MLCEIKKKCNFIHHFYDSGVTIDNLFIDFNKTKERIYHQKKTTRISITYPVGHRTGSL